MNKKGYSMIWYVLSALSFAYMVTGILKIREYSFAGIDYKALDRYTFDSINIITIFLASIVIAGGESYGFFMISTVIVSIIAIYARNELSSRYKVTETRLYILSRLLMLGMSIYASIMISKVIFRVIIG